MVSNHSILIFSVLFLISASMPAEAVSRYHSAACIAKSDRCGKYLSDKSGECVSKTKYEEQSQRCKNLACRWCKTRGDVSKWPCTSFRVRKLCGDSMPKTKPEDKKEPSMSKPEKCTYSGEDLIVVDFSKLPTSKDWTNVERDGLSGKIFMKDDKKTLKEGQSPPVCMNMKPKMSGDYYLTAVTYALHKTEYNDLFIKCDKKMMKMRGGDKESVKPNTFMKGYQNDKKMSDFLGNVDFKPHQLVVKDVMSDETVKCCVQGRSAKFEVFKIVMKKCSGSGCLISANRGKFISATPSKCM